MPNSETIFRVLFYKLKIRVIVYFLRQDFSKKNSIKLTTIKIGIKKILTFYETMIKCGVRILHITNERVNSPFYS